MHTDKFHSPNAKRLDCGVFAAAFGVEENFENAQFGGRITSATRVRPAAENDPRAAGAPHLIAPPASNHPFRTITARLLFVDEKTTRQSSAFVAVP